MLRKGRFEKSTRNFLPSRFSVPAIPPNTEWWRRVRHAVQRHFKTAVAALEIAIAVLSIVFGYAAAEVASSTVWDPNPTRTGGHIVYYGWPFVTRQIGVGVNGIPPYVHVTTLDYPANFAKNAGFYGVLTFGLLNAVTLASFGLHKWRKNRKKQENADLLQLRPEPRDGRRKR